MNLSHVPAGIDDPIETLFNFHRRIERQLAELGRLPARLEARGVDHAAARAAGAILDCFGPALLRHHAEQERVLMPGLAARVFEGGERRSFRALRAQLESDHREIERAWRMLRRPLEVLAEGLPRPLSQDDIRYFRTLVMMHVSVEEAAVYRLAPRPRLPAATAALSGLSPV